MSVSIISVMQIYIYIIKFYKKSMLRLLDLKRVFFLILQQILRIFLIFCMKLQQHKCWKWGKIILTKSDFRVYKAKWFIGDWSVLFLHEVTGASRLDIALCNYFLEKSCFVFFDLNTSKSVIRWNFIFSCFKVVESFIEITPPVIKILEQILWKDLFCSQFLALRW